MKDEELEILKIKKDLEEIFKDFKGSNYTKIKFDTTLSDYQYTIILKIIEYVHEFTVMEELFTKTWKAYRLPTPIKPTSISQILDEFKTHSYFCIQDNKIKRYVDYFHTKHFIPSITMNECIRKMDSAVDRFRSDDSQNEENIEELSKTLAQSIILINNTIFQFYFYKMHEENEELTFEQYTSFYPNRRFLQIAQSTHNNVIDVVDLFRFDTSQLPPKALNVVNSWLLWEKNVCAFSALCGLMLDAAAGTKEYFKPLKQIESVVRLLFHDAELYRLEFPLSPVDRSKATGSRGAGDHTTIMKLFLIDKDDNRIILRVDLPHVRSVNFHFNIECPDNKKYKKFNHYEIEVDRLDDRLISVLDILKDSIKAQMPHLHILKDTNDKDEKEILQDMEKLIYYRNLCLNYLLGNDCSKEKKKLAGYLRLTDTSIDKVIEEATRHFSI